MKHYNYCIQSAKRNKNACENTRTAGLKYKWGVAWDGEDEECLVLPPAPECTEAPWSRSVRLIYSEFIASAVKIALCPC